MRRVESLLAPLARGCGWPARWIAVATAGSCSSPGERQHLRITGLERWCAVVTTMSGPRVKAQWRTAGAAAAGLWSLLSEQAALPGPTWVISPRALRAWALLGFWEQLMTGALAIGCRRRGTRRPDGDGGLGVETGLLMADDPPTAASITWPRGGSSAMWVCGGNYGWRGVDWGESAEEMAGELADAISRTSLALAGAGLGGWGVTAGAMAARTWRGRYQKEPLYVHCHSDALALGREASFGGRLWVCPERRPMDGCYWVDGRALYPTLCQTTEQPLALLSVGGECSTAAMPTEAAHGAVLARVDLRATGGRFPARHKGATVYPQGPCQTTLCGAELVAALESGAVERCRGWAVYRLGQPLAAFAAACQSMRAAAAAAGDAVVGTLAKRLAVSAIGKMAGRAETWEQCAADYNDPLAGKWIAADGRGGLTIWRALGGTVSRRIRGGLSATAVPEVALWLWAAGRNWLWHRMVAAGLSNVLYADTDGMIVRSEGWERLCSAGLIADDAWGELRWLDGPARAEIAGPKMVRMGGRVVLAGVPNERASVHMDRSGFWFREGLGQTNERTGAGEWCERFVPRTGPLCRPQGESERWAD